MWDFSESVLQRFQSPSHLYYTSYFSKCEILFSKRFRGTSRKAEIPSRYKPRIKFLESTHANPLYYTRIFVICKLFFDYFYERNLYFYFCKKSVFLFISHLLRPILPQTRSIQSPTLRQGAPARIRGIHTPSIYFRAQRKRPLQFLLRGIIFYLHVSRLPRRTRRRNMYLRARCAPTLQMPARND